MAKDLMFQLAIEGPGKRLKEIKDQIDGWAKDMTIPIKVTADLNELKRQLKDLGVVFGENNKEIKKLATDVDNTIDRVNKKLKEVGSGSLKAGNIDRLHRMVTDLDVAIGRMENHKWLSGDNLKFSQNGQFYQQLEQLRELRKYIKELESDPNIGKKGWLSSLIWGGNGEQLMGGMTKRLFSTKTIDEAMKQMDDRMRQLTRQQAENAARYSQQMQQALRGGTAGGTQREQWEVKRDTEAIKANYEALLNQLRHLQQIRAHMSKEDPDFLNLTGMTNKLREFIGEYSRLMNDRKVMADPTAAQKFGEYFMKVWQHVSKVSEAYEKLHQLQSKSNNQPAQSPIDMKSVNEAVFQVARLEEKLSRLRELESKASGLGIDTSKLKTLISEMDSYLTKFRQIVDNGGKSNGGMTAQMLKAEGEFRSFTARISENTRELGRNIAEKNRGTSAEAGFANAIQRSTNELRGQSLILGDLRSLAQQYISIWAARSFVNNLIEQGGLLEQQRLSIGAILRDTAQANSLFGKIKGLALKSPFGVTELDSMTKQLSAYGFQYSELYDWTKRLADISAATGTEVSRLALALGHVRSEGALSGYTLRQFSMGNIPMLAKLSEKLGKTSAEIRKMVSKKEIGYDQVLEVFKELTDEGGMFYNAQETMAEALNAKFKNLRDSYQIMYSEMAEGAPGDALKKLAETLTELSKNWRVLLPMLTTGIGLWGMQKAVTMAVNYELSKEGVLTSKSAAAKARYTAATNAAIASTGRWTLALRGAGRALVSLGKFLISPWTLGFAAVEGLVYMWQKHNQEVEKARELTSGFSNQSSESMKNLNERLNDIDPYSEGMSESKLKTGIESMTETLKNYAANSKEVLETAFGEGADGKVKSLAEQYQYLRSEMEKTVDVYKEMQKTADAFEFGVNYTDGGWFDDNVESDLTDYANAVKEYEDAFTKFTADNQLAVQRSLEAIKQMEPVFKSVSDELKSDAERVKWLYENQGRWGTLYNSFKGQLRANGADYGGVLGYNTGYKLETQRREAEKELDTFFVGVEERMKKFGYDFTNNGTALTEAQVGNLLKQSREWLNKHPEWQNIYDVIWNKLNQRWGLPITPEIDNPEKPLNEWQQQMQNWLDKKGSTIKIKPEMTRQAIIDMVHNSIKETQAAIDQTKPILLKFKADLSDLDNLPIGLQTPWGRKQAADYKAAAPQNQTARNFLTEFGLPQPKEKKTGRKNHEDKELETWKKRISLLEKYRRELESLETMMTRSQAEAKLRADGNFAVLWDYFSNPNDYKGSLDLAANKLGKKGKRKEFVDELGAKKGAEDLREFKKNTEDAVSELGRMLDVLEENYEVYRDWMELTGNADIAAKVAGVTKNTSYADLLKEQFNNLGGAGEMTAGKFFGLNEVDAKKFGEKSGLFKLWQEWQKNNQKIRKDNVKLYADAIKSAKGYEEKIADVNRELQKQLEAIDKLASTPEEKERLKKNAKTKADEEIAGLTWENFKQTEEWGRIFSDLDRMSTQTLQRMITQLKAILPTINGDVEAVKELYSALNKMEKVVSERRPLQTIGESLGNRSKLAKYYKQAQKQGPLLANTELSKLLGVKLGSKVSKEQILDGMKNETEEFKNAIGKVVDGLNTFQNGLDLVGNLFDSLGMTGATNIVGDAAGLVGGAMQGASSLSALGPWGMAAGAALGLATGIFQLHDKSIQREIDALQENADALQENTDSIKAARARTLGYDNGDLRSRMSNLYKDTTRQYQLPIIGDTITVSSAVKEAMRDYYRLNANKSGYSAELENLKAQRDLYMEMYNLEEDKKKTSQDALDEYKSKIAELDEQILFFAEDLANELWGIDFKGWADQISDALWTAFENGEDALDAFHKAAKDIISDVAKRMMNIHLIEPKMAELENLLFGKIDSNGQRIGGAAYNFKTGEFNEQETLRILGQFFGENGEFAKVIESAESFYDMAQRVSGFDFSSEGSNSSMSSSIKGITEQTADLLSSYANSMRADLSVIREMDAKVVQQFWPDHIRMMTSGTQSLRNIENHTAAIMRSNDAIQKAVDDLYRDFHGLRTSAWKMPIA